MSIFNYLLAVFIVFVGLILTQYDKFDFASPDDDFGKNYDDMMSSHMWIAVIIICVLNLSLAYVMKMSDFRHSFDCKNIDLQKVWMPVLGVTLFLIGSQPILRTFGLDPLIPVQSRGKATFSTLDQLSFIVLFPIFFELFFRESIIRYLHSKGASILSMILTSAFSFAFANFFSVIAGFFICFVEGVVLAILFVKTGSVVINIFISLCPFILNYLFFPGLRMSMELPLPYCIVLLFACTPPGIFLLWKYWKSPLPDGRHHAFESDEGTRES